MKQISVILLVMLLFSVLPAFAQENGTYDIGGLEAPVAQREAEILVELGLMQGTDVGLELERPVTRAEAITMVVRVVAGEKAAWNAERETRFLDVPISHWASPYVSYGYQSGIIVGVSDSAFDPLRTVTGREFAKMLLSAVGYEEITIENTYDRAKEAGLLTNEYSDMVVQLPAYAMLRSDVARVCVAALEIKKPE